LNTPDRDAVPGALAIIHDPREAAYRVTIRPESVAMIDYQQLQGERTQYLTAVSTFMQSSAGMIEKEPGAAPMLAQLLKWGLAGFKGSSEIEGVMDKAIEAMNKEAAKPQDGKKSPEQQQAEMEAQKEQAKMQADMQKSQMEFKQDMQRDQQKFQQDMQKEQMKGQNEMQKIMAQLRADLLLIQGKTEGKVAEEQIQTVAKVAEITAQTEGKLKEIHASGNDG
ncbi:unnamed protein product, partial [marine sediment metagenome]